MIAKHKQQLKEQARKAESLLSEQQRKPSPTKAASAIPKRAARSTASDIRTKETLVDYAVQRAAVFSDHFQQPAAPQSARFTPAKSSGHNLSLFERSKNRWEREEDWLDSRAATVIAPASRTTNTSAIDGMFSGPPRTVDAAVRANAHRTPEPAMSNFVTTPRDVYREPPWMGSSETTSTPAQRRFEREVGTAVNWDTVFNS